MTIDILCRVVDNYGDIGVAYRLARALEAVGPQARLRLVVDRLEPFSRVAPGIDPLAPIQLYRGWTVYRWDEADAAAQAARDADYAADPPLAVIESFACGRPAWLESLLFASSASEGAAGPAPTIVNLEYLSAEPYADELHRAQSLTRSPRVRKRMFMPGFTGQTGGLILDPPFAESLALRGDRDAFLQARRAFLSAYAVGLGRDDIAPIRATPPGQRDVVERSRDNNALTRAAASGQRAFWAAVFGYPRDYSSVVGGLAEAAAGAEALVFAAAGPSQACVEAAWEGAGRPFPLVRLPFLPQEAWDRLVALTDFSIVRGEDSLSRAALAGVPFLWHAYPQADRHHLVKVRALLERMRPHFPPEGFARVEGDFLAFNDRDADSPEERGAETVYELARAGRDAYYNPQGAAIGGAGSASSGLAAGFSSFASSLRANGDLAAHLMTFLREIV